jgi:plastocyanin
MNMKNLLAVTSLAVALAAAGCGSSDNSGSSSSTDAMSTSSTAGSSTTSVQPTGGNVAVDVKGFAFTPTSLTVKKGTKVEWENYDSVAHDVVADDGTFKSGSLNKGDKFSYTADKPGTYSYVCTFHPNMKATLTVIG